MGILNYIYLHQKTHLHSQYNAHSPPIPRTTYIFIPTLPIHRPSILSTLANPL